jgi:NAD(P)-dependent dehydrogenase (short-subunit alcohol dehydrogenase family)
VGTLDNKVAWVTGAGTGIGEAAAIAQAREAAKARAGK